MDTLTIQKGQWLPLRFTFWSDSEKTVPISLLGAELSVRAASQPELQELVLSVPEPENGIAELTIPEAVSERLTTGRTNWLQLEAQFSEANILTPKIWIKADG